MKRRDNLFEFLEKSACSGAKDLLLSSGQRVSYEEAFASVRKFASFLIAQGIGEGDKVLLLLPNDKHFITGYFATLASGAVIVPLDIHFKEEIIYILKDTKPQLLLTHSGLYKESREFLDYPAPRIILTDIDEYTDEVFSLPQILRCTREGKLSPSSFEDDACILYTSGSTGSPKGTIKTHGNLITEIEDLHQFLKITNNDRFFSVIPWYHIYGMIHSLLMPVYAGSQIYSLEEYTPRSIVNFLKEKEITIFVGVPTLYRVISQLMLKEPIVLDSLRFGVSSGAPLAGDLVGTLNRKFGMRIVELYGSTETGGITINLNKLTHPESVGIPLPNVKLKILRDDKKEAQLGETGGIAVQGPTISTRSLQDEQIKTLTEKGSLYFTGDLGKRDEQNYIYLLGRSERIIKKGAKRISLREIENVLIKMDEISDVAVVARDHPLHGQVSVGFVVLKEGVRCGEDRILKWCRSKLAQYKIPKQIVFLDEIPRTSNGKIIYSKLR